MKTPIEVLMNEHEIISSAAEIAMKANALIGKDDDLYLHVINNLLNFFREYTDNIHHKKENLILFPEMSNKNEMLKDGIIKEMYDNHDEFHEMINNIDHCLSKKDYLHAQQQLNSYVDSLLDHIAVENEEVFQIAETLFNDNELENMYFRFIDTDNEASPNTKAELEKKLEKLRELL